MANIIRLLRFNYLSNATGKTRSTIYRDIKVGLLPPPVKIGGDRSAWPEHEIDAINRARIAGKTDEQIKQLVSQLVEARAWADTELQTANHIAFGNVNAKQ
jgi:prophage regulatory protein